MAQYCFFKFVDERRLQLVRIRSIECIEVMALLHVLLAADISVFAGPVINTIQINALVPIPKSGGNRALSEKEEVVAR